MRARLVIPLNSAACHNTDAQEDPASGPQALNLDPYSPGTKPLKPQPLLKELDKAVPVAKLPETEAYSGCPVINWT